MKNNSGYSYQPHKPLEKKHQEVKKRFLVLRGRMKVKKRDKGRRAYEGEEAPERESRMEKKVR